MARLIPACLALAALSLLLPSEPSYDPWAWLVWGRELAQLELDTYGGPSWKPLPVALLAVAAPLGELSVSLWMVIARAGALLALAMAFRLAGRLAGGAWPLRAAAGAVAALALALTPDWFQFAAHGSEAPLAVALMLWAVERHLDRRRGHAVALGAVVCLMRPELFPFLGLYGLWLWRAEPGWRRALAALAVAIPLAWLVPEWIGSGNPLDGGSQARSEPFWSLSHAERPWLRALERVHNHVGMALELLVAAALAAAAWRRERAVLVLFAAAAAEAALFVAMTQAGFSGNPRYVLPALTLLCVLAGVGAARAAEAGADAGARLGRRAGAARLAAGAPPPTGASRLASPAGAVLALLLVALLAAPLVSARIGRLEHEANEVGRRMELQRDLGRAVDAAGGPGAVRALGSATANRALHTRLAWELDRPIQEVERGYGHRVVFRTGRERLAGEVLVWGRARRRLLLARAGTFEVYRRAGLSYRLFTSSLQGIHILEPGGRNALGRVVTR
jgi:hypothetical protein